MINPIAERRSDMNTVREILKQIKQNKMDQYTAENLLTKELKEVQFPDFDDFVQDKLTELVGIEAPASKTSPTALPISEDAILDILEGIVAELSPIVVSKGKLDEKSLLKEGGRGLNEMVVSKDLNSEDIIRWILDSSEKLSAEELQKIHDDFNSAFESEDYEVLTLAGQILYALNMQITSKRKS